MQSTTIKHLLVPIDFSHSALNALNTALGMAKRHSAKITLLHVVNDGLFAYQHSDIIPLTAPTPILDALRMEAQERLKQIIEAIPTEKKQDLTLEYQTALGFVASEVCKVAQNIHADIVVMGTHGTSGFRAFFMGSNAYAVIKHSNCPVLTIPTSGVWDSFSKILFPIRDTPDALQKYDFLRRIIRRNKATLYVIGIPNAQRAHAQDWVAKQVAQLSNTLADDEVMCEAHIISPSDHVVEDVLKAGMDQNVDLIAITATLDFGIQEFFIGPYTQQMVNHAKIPVLSIRPSNLLGMAENAAVLLRADMGPQPSMPA